MRGNLPWSKIEAKTKDDKYRKIYKLKLLITPEKLCKDLPNEICVFLKYTRNLDFEQEPNYEYCCSLFNNILLKINKSNDLAFTWINNVYMPCSFGGFALCNDVSEELAEKAAYFRS